MNMERMRTREGQGLGDHRMQARFEEKKYFGTGVNMRANHSVDIRVQISSPNRHCIESRREGQRVHLFETGVGPDDSLAAVRPWIFLNGRTLAIRNLVRRNL